MCFGLNLLPQPSGPQNVTLFRKKVIADVTSLEEVTLEHGGPESKMTDVLFSRGQQRHPEKTATRHEKPRPEWPSGS